MEIVTGKIEGLGNGSKTGNSLKWVHKANIYLTFLLKFINTNLLDMIIRTI